jgi:cAMP-dependent protein kinase regulator
MSGLPPTYTNEIATLNREILKAQPSDILQFCANFFHRRLESQRTEFLLAKGGGGMSDFGSSNPFGNGASGFGGKKGSSQGMQNVIEEEEENDIGSPTDTKARGVDGGAFGFGTGAATGAAAGGLFSGPFGGHNTDDSSSPPSSMPNNYAVGRRVSVSAESMNPNADSDNWKPPNHAKTPEQLTRLKTAVVGNFLFSHLDDDQSKTVLGALVEKPVPAKDIKVISQGDDGDYFYVVEKGRFDIYINPAGSVQPGPEGMGNKVASIGPGGSFGELALMYNAPRAATVVSTEPKSTLWQLDRMTFRRILMDSAFQRRRMYEAFLEEVPLLANLKTYERSKIADALDTVKFPAGTNIITEGDPGDAFYILESGEADAYKAGVEGPVKHYKRGDFFGELALLDDKPRAASVVSKTAVKVAKLGRDGFQRLLGPVEEIMRKEKYDDNVDPLASSS